MFIQNFVSGKSLNVFYSGMSLNFVSERNTNKAKMKYTAILLCQTLFEKCTSNHIHI